MQRVKRTRPRDRDVYTYRERTPEMLVAHLERAGAKVKPRLRQEVRRRAGQLNGKLRRALEVDTLDEFMHQELGLDDYIFEVRRDPPGRITIGVYHPDCDEPVRGIAFFDNVIQMFRCERLLNNLLENHLRPQESDMLRLYKKDGPPVPSNTRRRDDRDDDDDDGELETITPRYLR